MIDSLNSLKGIISLIGGENISVVVSRDKIIIASTVGRKAITPSTLGTITDGITLDQLGLGSTLEVKTGGLSNAQIASAAGIVDTKLATIATAGKVSNSATTATSLNTASAIVARDGSGNFSAGTISAAISGNASTATALQTGRTINGTSFDGTANITVTAAAGTLSGTTLNSTVVASSLTSVGTLANLTVTNPISGSVTGNAATVTTNANLTGNVTSVGNATTIAAGVVTNAMLAGSIAYSKLSLTGAILNADLAGSIAYSKLSLTGAILNADLAGSIAYSKLSLTGAILNADLAGSIADSKLSTISTAGKVLMAAISGATDASDAGAGVPGEKIKGATAAGTSVGTSTQRFDAASVALTAGRWRLDGVIYYSKNSATLTAASGWELGISTTTGNSTTGLTIGDNWLSQSWPDVSNVTEMTMALPGHYVTISGNTTYFLKGRGVYSAGTPQYGARLTAIRL